MNYDLEVRTLEFGKNVIDVCKKIKQNQININIIGQLIRSATSIGANYREANGESSKNDFRNKIYICKKEVQETKYWLELLAHAESGYDRELRLLWTECHELTLIFGKIAGTLKK